MILNKMEKFNLTSTPLEKANLIEASAGTGKTYSIVGLVLRLLLEKDIPIEKILLVTFTEAAAAELKSRCNQFIRRAIAAINDAAIEDDKDFLELVNKATISDDEKIEKLETALLDIDKASMSTIHSFCLQSLTEFAFESNQAFNKEQIEDIDPILKKVFDEYWRTEIAVKPREEINNFNYDLTFQAVKNGMNGKELLLVENSKLAQEQLNYQASIEAVVGKVNEKLHELNLLTFDEMIDALYHKRNEKDLVKCLNNKYEAIFIDEFQDTDKKQYAIFSDIFQKDENKIIFYIGDPKQSIYSFRNADLNTYFKAKNEIDSSRHWTMDVNYRSSEAYIHLLNQFFSTATEKFHPFASDPKALDIIKYQNVDAAKQNNNAKGITDKHGTLNPFLIDHIDGKIESSLIDRVKYLLSNNKEVQLNGENVKPSDIGILVRKKKEGKEIKKLLEKYKIPAVIKDEINVFQSKEAKSIHFLLTAILNITQNNVDKWLIEEISGLALEDLKKVDYDLLLPKFKQWKMLWQEIGIVPMIEDVKNYFNLISNWKNKPAGQRKLSNIQQIIEILQEKAQTTNLNATEQLAFLKNQIDNSATANDDDKSDYIQRIESDENAIQISTIHSSKGLQYPIVLCAHLEMKENPIHQHNFFSFIDGEGLCFVRYHSGKILTNQSEDTYNVFKEKYKKQTAEENKRLIYVALTRAQYHCSLFVEKCPLKAGGGFNGNSVGTIHYHIKALEDSGKMDFFTENIEERFVNSQLEVQVESEKSKNLRPYPKLALPDKNFMKLSYSFLASKHASSIAEDLCSYPENSYDNFIFKTLPKGAQIGNLLHHIFEFIDFTDASNHEEIIHYALQRYAPSKVNDENYQIHLKTLINHVINVSMPHSGVSLKQIARIKRINELEFNFPVSTAFNPRQLEQILDENDTCTISTQSADVMGIMNGLIDLFFEYEGKYYILDWKSNFLGDATEDYNNNNLIHAMNSSNYHLQYLIYTLAAHKFLQNKLKNYHYNQHFGGVYYLFLRGVRNDQANKGIYFNKPNFSDIEKLMEILK